jgi:hypothetical protein
MGITVVVFVVAVAVLFQMLENLAQGRRALDNGKKPKPEAPWNGEDAGIRIDGVHAVAHCGCDMVDGRVASMCDCHAHTATSNLGGNPTRRKTRAKRQAELDAQWDVLAAESRALNTSDPDFDKKSETLTKKMRAVVNKMSRV